MLRGLLGGIVAAPFMGAALIYSLADWKPARSPYVFELPVMVFDCIDFPQINDGDTIPGWKFEQSIRMNLGGIRGTVYMPGYYEFPSVSSCGRLGDGSAGLTFVTFGPGSAVTIEEMR